MFHLVVWEPHCAVEAWKSHVWASVVRNKAVTSWRNSRLPHSSVWLCQLWHLVHALFDGL